MSIQLYCRIKEQINNYNTQSVYVKYKKKDYRFIFNHIWDGQESGYNIWDAIKVISSYKKNYYVFYGFTGSGKTYTSNQILIELFNEYSNDIIQMSAIQIYDNKIYDLYTNNELKYYKTDNLIIKNMTLKQVTNYQKELKILHKHRKITSTNHNIESSRSHAVYYIYTKNKQFIFVDMAGQECKVTYDNPIKRKESNNINMSILALKDCITNLKNKQHFIPFRRSILTLLLKNMFNGKSNINMICTISFKQPIYQQIDSMRYITDIKNITYHASSNNFHIQPITIYDEYIKYINEVEWCACQERDLCRKLKKQTITSNILAKIENYFERKLNGINKFKSFFIKYKQIYHE
tara:strand:+ start:10295 stop:11344 length:1050 start_codon:yes stop_codon:yes gene_type:complete